MVTLRNSLRVVKDIWKFRLLSGLYLSCPVWCPLATQDLGALEIYAFFFFSFWKKDGGKSCYSPQNCNVFQQDNKI